LPHRAVVVGGDREELLGGLAAVAEGGEAPGVAARGGGVVFVFPGQGWQRAGMGRELLACCPVFADAIGECEAALAPFTGWSVREVLVAEDAAAGELLGRVDVVQPVLWAVMVSLARLWRACGVEPAAVVGHSQGEIAAACVAGGLSLEDGARVVTVRSRAWGPLVGRGGMAWVGRGAEQAGELIGPWAGGLSVAAVNGPDSVVIAGETAGLAELVAACMERGVPARRLPGISTAGHSPQVAVMREEVMAGLAALAPASSGSSGPSGSPGPVMYSTVTGSVMDTAGLDAGYWYRNLREPVRFQAVVEELLARGHSRFVEISGHPMLLAAIQETASQQTAADEDPGVVTVGTLRRDQPEVRQFVTALGQAYAAGIPVGWADVLPRPADDRPLDLPGYPFQRQRYWLQTRQPGPAAIDGDRLWQVVERRDVAGFARLTGLAEDGADLAAVLAGMAAWQAREQQQQRLDWWRYRVEWTPVPDAAVSPVLPGTWLVVVPHTGRPGWADECIRAMRSAGAQVHQAAIGPDADRQTAAAALAGAAPQNTDIAGVVSLAAGLAGWHGEGAPAGAAATVAVIQALGDLDWTAPLWAITSGAVLTSPADDPGDPWQAAVWGLGRVAALEHPDRWGGLIDIPPQLPGTLAARLTAVLAGQTGQDQVAIRAAGLYSARLRRHPRPAGAASDWQLPGGAVLITGGTGTIGRHLARWIAGRGAEHIVLASRRGPDAPGATQLASELHALGVTTDIIACDLADPDAVTTLIHHASHHHPLHMIIHTAVALDDGVLDELTPDRFARVARAKALGAWHLHELTAHLPGCALVLFSSMAGTVGGAGQGNYAAANAFLDGLAAWRRARDLPTMVVAWGAWAGGGSVDADLAVEFERRGIMLMPPADALAALDGCLADGDESVLIANLDWLKFHSVFTATRPSPLTGDMIEKSGEEAVAEPRGDSQAFRDSLASLSANQAEAAVRELVRDHAATVLGHADSNEVDTTRGFNELGFTSLTSVELRNRLVAATGVRLPVVAVYDHPNVTALARYLLAELSIDHREGTDVVLCEIERLASVLRKTDRTTNGGEEVDRKLADLVDVWRARASGDEGRSGLDDDDILRSETVDDVFQILRDEFGRR
jgi:polyketide synthase 7